MSFMLANSSEYNTIRRKSLCYSACPNLSEASINEFDGEYVAVFRMDQFGSLISTKLQSNEDGIIKLWKNRVWEVANFDNPLRDPLTVYRYLDGTFELRNGYHRFCEAKARKYNSVVYAVILHESIDEDDEDDDEEDDEDDEKDD